MTCSRLGHGADVADHAPAGAGLHLTALAHSSVGHSALVHGARRLLRGRRRLHGGGGVAAGAVTVSRGAEGGMGGRAQRGARLVGARTGLGEEAKVGVLGQLLLLELAQGAGPLVVLVLGHDVLLDKVDVLETAASGQGVRVLRAAAAAWGVTAPQRPAGSRIGAVQAHLVHDVDGHAVLGAEETERTGAVGKLRNLASTAMAGAAARRGGV